MRVLALAVTAFLFTGSSALAATTACTPEYKVYQQARKIAQGASSSLRKAVRFQTSTSRNLNINYPSALERQERLIFSLENQRAKDYEKMEKAGTKAAYWDELEDQNCHGFPGTLNNWSRECNYIEAKSHEAAEKYGAARRTYQMKSANYDAYIAVINKRIEYISLLNDLKLSNEVNAYAQSLEVADEFVAYSQEEYRAATEAVQIAQADYNACVANN